MKEELLFMQPCHMPHAVRARLGPAQVTAATARAIARVKRPARRCTGDPV